MATNVICLNWGESLNSERKSTALMSKDTPHAARDVIEIPTAKKGVEAIRESTA